MRKNSFVLVFVLALVFSFGLSGCASGEEKIEAALPVQDVITEDVVETAENVEENNVEIDIDEPIDEAEAVEEDKVIEEEPIEEVKEDIDSEDSKEEIIEEKATEEISENATKESAESESKYHWILNTNSKKVHTENCSSVKEMKDKNKEESNLSPEELKKQGYTACGRCKPF